MTFLRKTFDLGGNDMPGIGWVLVLLALTLGPCIALAVFG